MTFPLPPPSPPGPALSAFLVAKPLAMSMARCASAGEATWPVRMIVSFTVRATISDLGIAAFSNGPNSPTSRPTLSSYFANCRPCASTANTVV